MTSVQKKHYIHVVIFLALTFGIGFLPPFAQITEPGMKILGAFVGVVYGWLFLGLAWPSFVGLIALGLADYGGGIAGSFQSGWAYVIIPQIVLCYLFAEAIAQTKFTNYIAKKLLSIKLFVGKPFALLFFFMAAMYIMNLLHCGMAALFLLWAVVNTIAKMVGYEEKNQFSTICNTALLVVFVFAAIAFPFNPGTLMQMGFFAQGMPDVVIDYFGWYVVWLILLGIYCMIWPLFVKFILRPDFSAVAGIKDFSKLAGDAPDKMNSEQKLALVMLIVFMVLMFAPSILPKDLAFVSFINKFGLIGVLMMLLCIMCACMKADGKPFLNLQDAGRKGIMWDVIWLLVATEPLANALNDSSYGIMPSLLGWLTPIITQLPPIVFVAAAALVLGAITQVVHNLVLMVVFIPILPSLYAQMGGDPITMFIVLDVALNAAFATPAASWSSAMLFGAEGMIQKQTYLHGFLHFLLTTLLAIAVVPFLVEIFMH